MVATSACISNKVRHKELLLINFSLGREISIGSSVSLVCMQGRPRRSSKRQPDVSLVGKFLSISVQVMGCFMREWMANIRNNLRGSYFEVKSTNEVKRHLDLFLEKGSIEGCCEKTEGLN